MWATASSTEPPTRKGAQDLFPGRVDTAETCLDRIGRESLYEPEEKDD